MVDSGVFIISRFPVALSYHTTNSSMAKTKRIIALFPVAVILMYGAQKFFNGFLQPYPFDPMWIFWFHLIILSMVLISSLIIFQTKRKKTGFVFLVWGVLKILLTLGFFIYILLQYNPPKQALLVTDFMTIYLISIVYELLLGSKLLKQL